MWSFKKRISSRQFYIMTSFLSIIRCFNFTGYEKDSRKDLNIYNISIWDDQRVIKTLQTNFKTFNYLLNTFNRKVSCKMLFLNTLGRPQDECHSQGHHLPCGSRWDQDKQPTQSLQNSRSPTQSHLRKKVNLFPNIGYSIKKQTWLGFWQNSAKNREFS